MRSEDASHRLVVNVDVEASGQRDNLGQLNLRATVYAAVATALERAITIPNAVDRLEDRGDGVLLLLTSAVPKAWVVGRWVEEVHQALRERNHLMAQPVRLRIGIHAGEVHRDSYGVAGLDVNVACRLAGCEPARVALRTAPRSLVVVAVSDVIYQSVVRHGAAFLDPDSYWPARLNASEYDGRIWLYRPGHSQPPRGEPELDVTDSGPEKPPSVGGTPPPSLGAGHPAAARHASIGGDGAIVMDSTARDLTVSTRRPPGGLR